MANGRTHAWAGLAAGGGAALYRGRHQPLLDMVVEGVGGAIGGYFGGKVPDVLEPAIHSWHRDFCHSWTVGAFVTAAITTLAEWESHCREKAAEMRRQRIALQPGSFAAFFYFLGEMLWTLAAGFVAGFGAGYVSHLVLDAATPRGLPLFCR